MNDIAIDRARRQADEICGLTTDPRRGSTTQLELDLHESARNYLAYLIACAQEQGFRGPIYDFYPSRLESLKVDRHKWMVADVPGLGPVGHARCLDAAKMFATVDLMVGAWLTNIRRAVSVC